MTTTKSANAAELVKKPPYSLEAEQAIIGGLMLDNQAWDKIQDKIEIYIHQTIRATGFVPKKSCK